jgi:hypothetical protein
MKSLILSKYKVGAGMFLIALLGLSSCARDSGSSNNNGGNNSNIYGSCQVRDGQYYLNGQIVSPQTCQTGLGNQQCQVINGQYYLNGQITSMQYCQQLQNQNQYYCQGLSCPNQGYLPYNNYNYNYNQRCTYRNYYGFWYQYCY